MRVGIVVCLVAVGVTLALVEPAAAGRCDTIRLGGRTYAFYYGNVSCSSARRWIRDVHSSRGRHRPRGYTCTSRSRYRREGHCATRTRSKYFGWQPTR